MNRKDRCSRGLTPAEVSRRYAYLKDFFERRQKLLREIRQGKNRESAQ